MAESLKTASPAPRARVQAMKEYHPPLGCRDTLRLDFNENTLACSPKVKEALAAVSMGSLTRYPEREPVEAMVAAHLGLKAEQVALTNGVDEAIHVLFEAFLEAGDELLLPVPTYTMYEVYASATDARVVAVQAGDDLQFPFERLLAAITPKTKVIAIANPNSPSGSAATREQILELARRAPHAVVLVDEAYFHFHGETVMDLVGTVPNLIVARTFSKAYGLAGLRLGLRGCSASRTMARPQRDGCHRQLSQKVACCGGSWAGFDSNLRISRRRQEPGVDLGDRVGVSGSSLSFFQISLWPKASKCFLCDSLSSAESM